MATDRREVRRRFFQLVLSVAAFDAAMIAIWYFMDIRDKPEETQTYFAWGWMLATIIVVGVGLKRFHAARREWMRNR